MLCMYSDKISILCGINAALIAGYIWNESKENAVQFQGKDWIRCSKRNLCVIFPFIGGKAVSNALKKLVNAGILKKCEYNDSSFDRTASYAFTEIGEAFMTEEEEIYGF